jgi:hypothetical protein
MPSDPAPPRRSHALRQLLLFTGLALGIGALLRTHPPIVTARGKRATPPSGEAVMAGYETTDINARDTAFILAGIAATTALVIGIVSIVIWRFDVARHASFSHLTPQETARFVPPAPHLQVDPLGDLARERAREERLLTSYGWTSADHTTARIPIDRAMALTVGKSLDAPP